MHTVLQMMWDEPRYIVLYVCGLRRGGFTVSRLKWRRSVACTGSGFTWRFYWNMQTEHCSTSRCPPRKVSEWRWWMWGLLLKSEEIRSILDTDGQKSGSYIDVDAYLEEQTSHANLCTTMCLIPWSGYWLGELYDACNNEDYANIWTRPNLDTFYLLMTPIKPHIVQF